MFMITKLPKSLEWKTLRKPPILFLEYTIRVFLNKDRAANLTILTWNVFTATETFIWAQLGIHWFWTVGNLAVINIEFNYIRIITS